MAAAVADTLEDGGVLLVEAGTGTGKTLAYLVPAILSGQRVIVSTGTKNLQEQIFTKDLPLLARVLPVSFTATCMKGRGNYLCLQRYEVFKESPALRTDVDRVHFALIDAWAEVTETGDRAEIDELPDDLPFWHEIAATAETCAGSPARASPTASSRGCASAPPNPTSSSSTTTCSAPTRRCGTTRSARLSRKPGAGDRRSAPARGRRDAALRRHGQHLPRRSAGRRRRARAPAGRSRHGHAARAAARDAGIARRGARVLHRRRRGRAAGQRGGAGRERRGRSRAARRHRPRGRPGRRTRPGRAAGARPVRRPRPRDGRDAGAGGRSRPMLARRARRPRRSRRPRRLGAGRGRRARPPRHRAARRAAHRAARRRSGLRVLRRDARRRHLPARLADRGVGDRARAGARPRPHHRADVGDADDCRRLRLRALAARRGRRARGNPARRSSITRRRRCSTCPGRCPTRGSRTSPAAPPTR